MGGQLGMTTIVSQLRKLRAWSIVALLMMLLHASPLWAQGSTESEGPKGYAANYIIIIFAVGLGLLVICKAGKRTTNFRRD